MFYILPLTALLRASITCRDSFERKASLMLGVWNHFLTNAAPRRTMLLSGEHEPRMFDILPWVAVIKDILANLTPNAKEWHGRENRHESIR